MNLKASTSHPFQQLILTMLLLVTSLLFTGCQFPLPVSNCNIKGGISITTAGNASNEWVGEAYVCKGEQVKLIWSHTNANSVKLKIGNSASEDVEPEGEKVITVDKNLFIDMTAKGNSCDRRTVAKIFAMYDGAKGSVRLSAPHVNDTPPLFWNGMFGGAPITDGLKVKGIRLTADCGASSWTFKKIDNDGIEHSFTVNSGAVTTVNFIPSGTYKAFPNISGAFYPNNCAITIELIMECR